MATYIHQRQDWPSFSWNEEQLLPPLGQTRHRQGRLTGRMEALGFELRAEANLETLTQDVLKSSEIEDETLDASQVRSSLARRLGLEAGGLSTADRHVEGVVEMMLDATQNYAQPLTAERLFDWHAALFPTGRSGLRRITVGAWRPPESDPMQVVSGAAGRERVHYQAPAAERVPEEMRRFLDWFNAEPKIDAVLKAAVAHFWFVTIHPFEDGNGRIARAIADLALARSEASPQRFYSMSAQIQRERRAYYDILEGSQRGTLDITYWLLWFLACLDRAFDNADAVLAAVMRKGRFWTLLANEPFNPRQREMVNRLLDGFEGKLTTSKWAALAKTSQDTALRDIEDLVRRRVLVREAAGGRSTSYRLLSSAADALRQLAKDVRERAPIFAHGPEILSPEALETRVSATSEVARELDRLADEAETRPVTYAEFRQRLDVLVGLGAWPRTDLVSAAAFWLKRAAASPAEANAVPEIVLETGVLDPKR